MVCWWIRAASSRLPNWQVLERKPIVLMWWERGWEEKGDENNGFSAERRLLDWAKMACSNVSRKDGVFVDEAAGMRKSRKREGAVKHIYRK